MLGQTMPSLGSTSQTAPGPHHQGHSGPTAQMPSAPNPQNPNMMAPTAQGPPGGYQQMGPEGFGGMMPGGGAAGSQYSPGDPAYSQYSSMSKMPSHHGDGMMGMGMSQQPQGGMPVMQPQQQFGSPPAGGMIQQHSGYQGYNMPGGPMPSQQQPMGMMGQQQGMMGQQQSMMGQQGMMGQPGMMSQQGMMGQQQQGMMGQQQGMMGQQQGMMGQQGSGWNPAQSSPSGSHPQFMSPQPQQQGPQGCMPQPMGQSYMGQHDYGMQQNMGHFGDKSAYMQQQASPMAGSGGMNMMGSPMQRQARPPFQSQPPMHQPNPGMPGYPMQPGQRFTGDYMPQRPPQQRYPFQQSSGQNPQALAPDGTPISHYPSQNQATSYMSSSYSGTSHPTAIASPCPPAASQSVAGSHSSGVMGQGTYGQSHLQELEQLVSPTQTSGAIPSANPYQQIMQSSGTSVPNVPPHSPIYSSASFPTTTVSSSPTPVQAPSSTAMSNTGPLSPNPGMRPGMGQQSGITMEIQRLEKHIQQLFNSPQSQQVSQQLLDMQERLRTLKAQQQQQIMQMQRQQHQQQQQMNMNSPTRMGGKPGFGQQTPQLSQQQIPGMGQQRPRLPGQMNMTQQPGMGPGGTGPMMGVPGQPPQLQVQGQLPSPQVSPQKPPPQSAPISSPQRIQPFQVKFVLFFVVPFGNVWIGDVVVYVHLDVPLFH